MARDNCHSPLWKGPFSAIQRSMMSLQNVSVHSMAPACPSFGHHPGHPLWLLLGLGFLTPASFWDLGLWMSIGPILFSLKDKPAGFMVTGAWLDMVPRDLPWPGWEFRGHSWLSKGWLMESWGLGTIVLEFAAVCLYPNMLWCSQF